MIYFFSGARQGAIVTSGMSSPMMFWEHPAGGPYSQAVNFLKAFRRLLTIVNRFLNGLKEVIFWSRLQRGRKRAMSGTCKVMTLYCRDMTLPIIIIKATKRLF